MLGQTLEQILPQLGGREVRIVETAPPFVPRGYVPIWGQKRVVRLRELPDGALEIVVARELLREEKNRSD